MWKGGRATISLKGVFDTQKGDAVRFVRNPSVDRNAGPQKSAAASSGESSNSSYRRTSTGKAPVRRRSGKKSVAEIMRNRKVKAKGITREEARRMQRLGF